MAADKHVHRLSLLPLLVVSILPAACLLVIVALLTAGPEIDLPMLAAALGGIFLAGGVGAVAMVRGLVVETTSSGLRGYDFWSRYRFVKWEEITATKPLSFLGLRFVRLVTQDGRPPLWVPLFSRDMADFHAQVRGAVAAEHPLRAFLEKPAC